MALATRFTGHSSLEMGTTTRLISVQLKQYGMEGLQGYNQKGS